MGDLSPHFSLAEFRDKRTGVARVETTLVRRLEALRALVNKPLPIVSGYRSPSTNSAVGGAAASQHLHGWAADIPAGYATVEQAKSVGFTGIGISGRWAVHVDTRDTPSVVTWVY